MRYVNDLIPATLMRRYKRFLADVRLPDGQEVVAHCPNPGAMTGLAQEGARIWLEPNDDHRKKLNYGWRLIELSDAMVCIDTSLANRIVGECLIGQTITPLKDYDHVRAEVPYGTKSRVDFLLTANGLPDAYVEVKSVTLSRKAGIAEFPDTKTARGARHMEELSKVAQDGARAVLIYLIQRTDCNSVRVAADIDPAYAAASHKARIAGVEILCLSSLITPEGISLSGASDQAQLYPFAQ